MGSSERSEDWFGELRRRLVRSTRSIIRSEDVEDLVQETLVIVWEKYGRRIQCLELHLVDAERLSKRVLYHRLGNYFRRASVHASRSFPLDHVERSPSTDTPERRYERWEQRQALAHALRSLPRAQRAVLGVLASTDRWRRADGNRGAEYAQVYRARQALRRLMAAGAAWRGVPGRR